MPWFISINKQTIAQNIKRDAPEPPVRIAKNKSGKGEYCFEAEIPSGSKIVYDPHGRILNCGARMVIECPEEPKILR